MNSPPAGPPASDLMADYYRLLGELLQMAWGDNFHLGYWEGPDDTSSVQEATDRLTDVLAARLRVGPGSRVLDVGCGIGSPALRVAATTGAGVFGITTTPEHVEQAAERAREQGMADRVTFQQADGMDMPFEPESFDAVLALESIMHMGRPTALREMARVLAPGGRLVLTDVFPLAEEASDNPQAFGTLFGDAPVSEQDPGMASLARFEDWPDLVSAAGLRLDELTDITENVQNTFPRMLDGFIDRRREFERQHGVSVEQVLDHTRQANPVAAGCLVMAAHKP
ncbi:SAM-dependent methyltransferase [Streptomyces smyrnaeus]|uniref:SAM-dependent methyltransferase n=1 Tax=Streptomyces smyrnaeus TaxID=1387713 RepID=UPI0037B26E1C